MLKSVVALTPCNKPDLFLAANKLFLGCTNLVQQKRLFVITEKNISLSH